MRSKQSISPYILGDVKLSQQDLLDYAYDLSLVHRVYRKKTKHMPVSLVDARRHIENAYLLAKRCKYSGCELPAIAEWFYDNRSMFIEQIKLIELSQKKCWLPRIKNGRMAHYPRSFVLAVELIAHSALHVTTKNITAFLDAYQQGAGLDSGELWVFVDMLKTALLIAASEISRISIVHLKMRSRAEQFCKRILADTDAAGRLMAEYKHDIRSPLFIADAAARLRESPQGTAAIAALDRKLSVYDLSTDMLIKKAHAMQARNIMLISNAITSLRMLAKISFESLFEDISLVHRYLSKDDDYQRMDFESRDDYRRRIAKIADVIGASEPAVAKKAVALSRRDGLHVGHYIAGQKRDELVAAFGRLPLKYRATRFLHRHMLLLYAGSNVVSTLISAALLCISLFYMYPVIYGIIGFVISLIPIYTVAAAVNNRIFSLLNKPAFIPKMALKDGIPEESATMVVIPALVTGLGAGRELLERMQVYYAANQQDNIYFTLLSDFKDNENEITLQDKEIIESIEKDVQALNKKYDKTLFFYAQRKRTYIAEKNNYSGWERKRGALLDFSALLSGDDTAFAHATKGIPEHVRYVITLDADTELSRDAAVKMVGAMMHPLNTPVIDPGTNTVKTGYGIMQPRIGIDVVSAASSRFSLVFAGKAGLDTYACAASDVYQDGFGTGIFTGKGIFDIAVYRQVLGDAFPDNRILSHDLLEGSYLRCALISDVVLMDGYPAKYNVWSKRQHRWTRGDWQLLPWLSRTVPAKKGRVKNPLSGLAKYQIFDNMRRSLAMPLSFIVILLSQTAFYRSAFFWFISGILPLFIDSILDFVFRIVGLIRNAGKGALFKDAWYETKTMFEQAFYRFSFLPYETYCMLDAVVRTIVRVAFTKKKMLEWVTAAQHERNAGHELAQYWREMRAAPILAAVLYALSIFMTGRFSIVALAVSAVWFFAPSIAYAISRPRHHKAYVPDAVQKTYLEDIALRTWRFFERFSKESPYLWMPDNYQHSPGKGVAYRTSPTNVAYSIVADICAYYMGFCPLPQVIAQIERCVSGIEKADKWHGHLYNWYDITDLKPLDPMYVSSVDSGNLACYLTVAREAVEDMLTSPLAAHMQRGMAAVSREDGKEVAFGIGDDIYSAVTALDLIDAGDSALGAHKKALIEYLDKYAGWARVLCMFPSQHVHRYAALTQKLRDALRKTSLRAYIAAFHDVLGMLSAIIEKAEADGDGEVLAWTERMETALGDGYIVVRRLIARTEKLKRRMAGIFDAMDFGVLYDDEKGLFSIGIDIRHDQMSDTHYDLLASEARQTGFIAIAKGDVPGKHWFRLSRPLTVAGENRVLLSWGGTMFEYLMPLLIMKSYDHTLLSETYKTVVAMQYSYGEQRRVPWGVSESGYYAFDLHMNYQYKAFGIPGLGMKAGLVRELVISPYATVLALQVDACAALSNMERLQKIGALGRYGFYEAIDYTPTRMHHGKRRRIIKSYMAHHQGMILASILNGLQSGKLQTLFHSATCVKATEMLLKEKVPPRSVTLSLGEKQKPQQPSTDEIRGVRAFEQPGGYPEAHFLSNGTYSVMVTQYGTGYSKYDKYLISRWYRDCLRRAPGIHIYIKDNGSGAVWSAAMLPTCLRTNSDHVVFEPHKAVFTREVGSIVTTLVICVSPECDMEIRSLDIKNNGADAVSLGIYCAFTPALCSENDFTAHPAFSELFVQTHTDPGSNIVYARHREKGVCCGMKVCTGGKVDMMTDRTAFFGRQRPLGIPACLANSYTEKDVARTMGIAADVDIPAKKAEAVTFAIAASDSMKTVAQCLAGISGEEDARRTVHLAWTHAQVEMRYQKLKDQQINVFQKIASRTVIAIPPVHAVTAPPKDIAALWALGLSGDIPIICLFAHDADRIAIIKALAGAQAFMHLRRVDCDLVIIYDGGGEYLCPLRDRIKEMAQAASGWPRNRITAISREHTDDRDIATIVHASCMVLDDSVSLSRQLHVERLLRPMAVFEQEAAPEAAYMPKQEMVFDNGRGGFCGSEYCIYVTDMPPLPWSNILTNKKFGSLISAGGGGYTWADNARMNRLTPFRNDALTDVPVEGVIVRNDRTGRVTSAAPDIYASGRYRVTHGFGYTVFESCGGLDMHMQWFVDSTLPVKAGLLRLTNNTGRDETFSVYYYAETGLGSAVCHSVTAQFRDNALFASVPLDGSSREMFIAMPGHSVHYTASGYEFFGMPGYNILPEAVKSRQLSGSVGRGASVLALQTAVALKAGETKVVPLLMGYGNEQQISETSAAMGDAAMIESRLAHTKEKWQQRVLGIRVKTSNASFDTLVNGWLTYQTYASRLWGRTGYYQSGGAYGFRDQLQDVLALLYTDPDTVRAHILRCAQRQFIEGDVLHWWHEPAHGVRTHISDDKLFLPYVACEYARVTGDNALFDEQAAYLTGIAIPDDKTHIYENFQIGDTNESVYDHCRRAIDSALVFGDHGLPLMGTGDWNDGMDRVGEGGKGESVWLAFFLTEVLRMFAAAATVRGDSKTAERYEKQRQQLRINIERNAWDGQWYMRAFFDDGTPIGSSASPECQIDLVSQAWAAITGAVRARQAFIAADRHLVMREYGVIRLLAPPFDKWDKDPGYIKEYLPGIRENGGQYTHAAAWYVIAAARLRRKDDALALFQRLNPIEHTRTPADVEQYKGEPFVVAADVYYDNDHKGRAGWTWYTGSAGWMYQAALVHILGMRIENGALSILPCVPDDFGQYTISYKKGGAEYVITVDIVPGYYGNAWLSMDGGRRTKRLKLEHTDGVHEIYACWHGSGHVYSKS